MISPEARERGRRAALIVLWLALAAQVAWILVHYFRLRESWGSMWYPLTFGMPFFLLALTMGRVRSIASLLRLPPALAFLDAVADRFGLLGPHGAPGVAWGDFAHFVAYTAQVNSFVPSRFAPSLAIFATLCEMLFGLALLLGVRLSLAALGSAALLFLFGTAMTISGFSQFAYSVYLMAAGALALSTVDASLLSLDALLSSRKKI
ncbi:MAG: DoxX family protein [Acidobacteriota bacterium]|nr:DoxX family protein [Acidobacteriota bacterium]